jgi:hypothetical protein
MASRLPLKSIPTLSLIGTPSFISKKNFCIAMPQIASTREIVNAEATIRKDLLRFRALTRMTMIESFTETAMAAPGALINQRRQVRVGWLSTFGCPRPPCGSIRWIRFSSGWAGSTTTARERKARQRIGPTKEYAMSDKDRDPAVPPAPRSGQWRQ